MHLNPHYPGVRVRVSIELILPQFALLCPLLQLQFLFCNHPYPLFAPLNTSPSPNSPLLTLHLCYCFSRCLLSPPPSLAIPILLADCCLSLPTPPLSSLSISADPPPPSLLLLALPAVLPYCLSLSIPTAAPPPVAYSPSPAASPSSLPRGCFLCRSSVLAIGRVERVYRLCTDCNPFHPCRVVRTIC